MDGLERVTVLVVEDCLQIRNLLASVMKRIGVGIVLRASDGLEAIELLKEIQKNPVKVGASEVDLIIADWVMEPVDGLTLLRWVRRHKESPDHFLPFYMMSAHSETDRVKAARDLGVTEFITKPFRIDDICAHVQATVKDTRKFVKSPDYFGPNRRRRDIEVEVDRRGEGENTAKFFEAPRKMFSKVGGDLKIDQRQVEQAIAEVEEAQDDFIDWARTDLGRLEAAYEQAKAMQDPTARTAPSQDICRIAHEFRGQSGVFGYPLITVVAESLFRFTDNITGVPDDGLKLIRTHADLIGAILREDISGDGGDLGPALMESLKIACANFLDDPDHAKLVGGEFIRHAGTGADVQMREAQAMSVNNAA
jgi:DNA-binding response OmpR family regulator